MTTPELARSEKGIRYYTNPATGRDNYISVSNVKGALDTGPGLLRWYARMAAEYAVDNQARWKMAADRDEAVRIITSAANTARDTAANRGTAIHALAERIGRGERITEAETVWQSADHQPFINALHSWVGAWGPTFHNVELTLFNDTYGYAGTTDAIAHLPGIGTVIVDYKTGRVYGDQALQLAAYRYAEYGIMATPTGWTAIALPDIVGGVIVKLDEHGEHQTIPLECGPDTFNTFVDLIPMARFQKRISSLILPAVQPPRDMTAERRTNLLTRMERLRAYDGAIARLGQAWPHGVDTFRQRDRHTMVELDAIETVLASIEDQHEVPFNPAPAGTPPAVVETPGQASDADVVPLHPQADPDAVQGIVDRLKRLPHDLLAACDVEARHHDIPNLLRGAIGITTAHLQLLDRIVTEAEEGHRARVEMLDQMANTTNIGGPTMIQFFAIAGRGEKGMMAHETIDDIGAEILMALYVCENMDMIEPTEAQMVAHVGSKSEITKAAKPWAERLGIKPPRSAAAVTENPALAALVAANI